MNLFSKKDLKNLLKKYRVYPSKRLGQNFLIDKSAAQKVIKAADLTKKDLVLEIGPGIGNLTQELAKNAGKVVAVEKDRKMAEILRETLKDFNNVKIIQGDILKIENLGLGVRSYKLIANLPYYITSPVIRKFLESPPAGGPPKLMVLTVQKEVARRICVSPPNMSLLAVSVQFYAKPEIISFISKKSFWPSPKVDGAIIRITPLITTDKKRINVDLFFRIVKAGFSQPRKQLVNNLLALSLPKGVKLEKEKVQNWLLKNKISPSQRAETLSAQDWLWLAKNFKDL